jgi:hypothetical protein
VGSLLRGNNYSTAEEIALSYRPQISLLLQQKEPLYPNLGYFSPVHNLTAYLLRFIYILILFINIHSLIGIKLISFHYIQRTEDTDILNIISGNCLFNRNISGGDKGG